MKASRKISRIFCYVTLLNCWMMLAGAAQAQTTATTVSAASYDNSGCAPIALTTVFPTTNNNLARQLNMVAKVIAARNILNMRRQVFFVTLDGFDTHGDQLVGHTTLLQQLSQAMNAFYSALVELKVENQVTSFTASDFGRALKPNGSGTDHGWGGHHFVLGCAVDGGKIFGTFPDLTLENATDAGNGRLIPTTAVDQYAATLASWFGVPGSELTTVVPNIGNFASNNLGFML